MANGICQNDRILQLFFTAHIFMPKCSFYLLKLSILIRKYGKKDFNYDFLAILTKEMKIETKFFTISYLHTESKIKISSIMPPHKMFNFSIIHTKIKVKFIYTISVYIILTNKTNICDIK